MINVTPCQIDRPFRTNLGCAATATLEVDGGRTPSRRWTGGTLLAEYVGSTIRSLAG
jgi:hypothetical protein